MRLSMLLSSFTFGAAVALTAGSALAAKHGRGGDPDGDYPLVYAMRPMTLPRLTLAPELEFEAGRALSNSAGTTTAGSRYTLAGINLGATFGITNNVEIGAYVLPIQFAPAVTYGSPDDAAANLQLFGTFRFLHGGPVEIGARLRTYFVTATGAGAMIVPSVPFLFHLGRIARIDAEIALPITARGNGSTGSRAVGGSYLGVAVPLSFAINIIEPLHVGVSSGFHVDDVTHERNRAFVIPLGLFAGFAIGGKRPIVDLTTFFQFNDFFRPTGGALGKGDKIVAGDFHTGLAVKGYFYF